MIVKYKTKSRYVDALIHRVEVVRETEQFVVVVRNEWGARKERREAKSSEYDQYHDTWEAAHAYLITRAEQGVKRHQEALQQARSLLGNIKSMKQEAA